MKAAELLRNPPRRFARHQDYVANLALDALDWARFRAFAEDHDQVEILDVHLDADRVVVSCGCSTVEIRERLEDAWA